MQMKTTHRLLWTGCKQVARRRGEEGMMEMHDKEGAPLMPLFSHPINLCPSTRHTYRQVVCRICTAPVAHAVVRGVGVWFVPLVLA